MANAFCRLPAPRAGNKNEDHFLRSHQRIEHTTSVTHLFRLVNGLMGHFSGKIVLRIYYEEEYCLFVENEELFDSSLQSPGNAVSQPQRGIIFALLVASLAKSYQSWGITPINNR